MTERTTWLVVGLTLGLTAGVLGSEAWHWLDENGSRRNVDLASFVGDPALPGGRWATDELCDDEVPCFQAVRADDLTLYRFPDRDDALAVGRSFAGDAYVSGWMVVRFEPGALTADERVAFAGRLDCIDVGVAEGGLEC
ncbi:hypothetical protein [Geodermatophilus sp. FMUSA9-8]|uniref:hypothetical protein n=1 Tax=Geodermatophilus sp. FMUSA9-8 TaxID=3120155 RepID=UPI00300BBE2C